MTETITLSGDYGYTQYKITSAAANVIDASEASWILANIGDHLNAYPFYAQYFDPGLKIIGGRIYGEVSQTLDWQEAYVNSAAVLIKHSENVTVQDWIITRPWDGIRIAGDTSDNFIIENNWITHGRDDAVENDYGLNGTIKNNLFDGVFSGISLGSASTPDSTHNVVTVENNLIRMETYLYRGKQTHASPFKTIPESQSLRIFDTVIAIEDVNHNGQGRLQQAWDKTIEASGNYLLNMTDKPWPLNYPLPSEGWTILEGQAARDYWEQARSEWIEARMESSFFGSDLEDDSLQGTNDDEYLAGLGGDDELFGYEGDDVLDGHNGDDILHGGLGADIMNGGAGIDTVSYRLAAAGVTVSLWEASDNTGEAWGDTFLSIENIEGSDFDDVLVGDEGANQIQGMGGSDIVNGGDGDDLLIFSFSDNNGNTNSYDGDAGQDHIKLYFTVAEYTQAIEDDLHGYMNFMNSHKDVNQSSGAAYNLSALGLTIADVEIMDVYVDDVLQIDFLPQIHAAPDSNKTFGTDSHEVIIGNNLSEQLLGLAGNDVIYGNEGNDLLKGYEGNDIIYGGAGMDTIWGDVNFSDTHEGHDVLYGGANNDRLYGFYGDDTLYGDEGNDLLRGYQGNDILEGGSGNDRLEGGDGADNLFGGPNNDTLEGGADNDVLRGGEGFDKLYGQDGDDILYGGAGWDYLIGGAGSDKYIFDDLNDYAGNQYNRVRDYDVAEDVLDIRSILENTNYDPLTDALTDFVAVIDNGSHTYVRVNETGSGIQSDYTTVIMLEGKTGITTGTQDMVDNGYLIV